MTSPETRSDSLNRSFRYPDLGFSFCKIWDRKNVDNCHRTEPKEENFFFFFLSSWISGMFIGLLIMPRLDAVCSLSSNHFWDPECSDSFSHCFPRYICVKWFTRRKGWAFLLWSPECRILLTALLLSLTPHAEKKDSPCIFWYRNLKFTSFILPSRSPSVSSCRCCRENNENGSSL